MKNRKIKYFHLIKERKKTEKRDDPKNKIEPKISFMGTMKVMKQNGLRLSLYNGHR